MKNNIVTALILSMTITTFPGIPVRAEEVQEETFAQETVSEGQRNENLEGVVQEELGEEGLRSDEPDEAEPRAEESETELCIERDTEKPGRWVLNSTGWWYAYDDGTWPAGGIVSIQGTDYAFDASGYMVTGWYLSPEGWYYFQGNGAKATGWLLLGNTWYYLDGPNEESPGLMAENCKKVIGDVTYFFAAGGAMQTGWVLRPEGWYYLGSDGAKKSGWHLVGGAWYYLDGTNETHPGRMAENCRQVIGNATYFFAVGGAMRTGWIQKPEGWYYAAGSGSQIAGWAKVGDAWYYLDPENEEYPGLMLADEKKVIGNATYFFNRNGAMRTDWISQPEGWYYADTFGSVGWKWVGDAWYYLDGTNEEYPGLMIADEKRVVDGSTYFFNASGAMLTGWIQRPEGWYYAASNGVMITGWVKLGGAWYYLNGADEEYPGRMLQDCTVKIGGQEYTFTGNGAMRSGWVKDQEGHWYYYHPESGQMTSGWQLVGGAWYYLDPANKNQMLEGGWHVIDGAWYYMHGSGAMATNWLNLGGEWYFLAGDGAMRTGWQWIDSNWYYFYTQNDPHGGVHGMMARNTTIDGYRLQGNGAMLTAEQSGMALRAQAYSSNTNYLLMVDRAACRVGVFTGRTGAWNLNYFWSCSPGAPSTPTVGGVFKVQSKGYYFDSGSARCYWYTQFYGNYLFHSVLYNKYTGGLADGRLGMHLSHGCVRLEIGNAKWIYDTVPSGTTVVVY